MNIIGKIYVGIGILLLPFYFVRCQQSSDRSKESSMIQSHKINPEPSLYTLKILNKPDIGKLTSFIVQQRLKFYQSYPYLYVGESDLNREQEYIEWMATLQHTILVVAYDKETPIGFCFGTALVDHNKHVEDTVEIFKKNGLKPEAYFYISDLIIQDKYRTDQIYTKILNMVEEQAKKNGYSAICVAEHDHENDTNKPDDFVSFDQLLLDSSYKKTSMFSRFHWQTLQADGSIKDQDHRLVYWIKELTMSFRSFRQNKLWRDKVVNLVEKSGSKVHWEKLGDKEFLNQLKIKLMEEAEEVCKAKSKENVIEELADVLEVIIAFGDLFGFTLSDVIDVNKKKAQEKGGFAGRKFVSIAEHLTGSFSEQYCLNDPEKYPEILDDSPRLEV